MSYFKAKMHQIQFPPLRELTALLQTPYLNLMGYRPYTIKYTTLIFKKFVV